MGHADIEEMLLSKGADVNQPRTDIEATALHIASQEGHSKVVEKLLAHGANTNVAMTDDGYTPLYAAAGAGHTTLWRCCLARVLT